MGQPFEQFQVSWQHLNYTIQEKPSLSRQLQERLSTASLSESSSSRKTNYDVKETQENGPSGTRILQNLDGSFRSGQLTAVMGPSGAGKTSLLNFLSRRQHTGFSGNLTVGQSSGQPPRRLVISAIPQNDHLPEYLSVRENLMFACRFKNPSDGREEQESNVLRVSNLLGLDDCLDTRTKSISGGQQKRLAIAQELLSKPDILILDEPTSGLDSLTCLRTLSVLKDLVRASAKGQIEPIAVVLTIHQPQMDALALFDKVCVLASGGVAIYDGPPERCSEFVAKCSGGLRVPVGYNPASFLVEIGSREFGQTPIDLLSKQVEQEHHWKGRDELHFSQELAESRSSGGSWWRKTLTLFERCFVCMIRDPKQLVARILLHLMLPLGMLLIVGRKPGQANACPKFTNEYNLQRLVASDEYTSQETQVEFLLTHENVVMFYILIYSCICANVASTTLLFTLDMRSSLRETHNGWYSMNCYILARLLANFPMDLILPTVSVALTYWLTGQQHSPADINGLWGVYRVMIISAALVIGSSIGQMIGMTFGAIYVHQISTALFMSQAATLPFVLLSGFLVRIKEMSTFVRWLSLTSLYRHCLAATYIARYGFNVCGCTQDKRRPMFGSTNVTMTGVPDSLRAFAGYWLLQDEPPTTNRPADNDDQMDDDVFQLVAKQLSLYNTYGIQVESCKDVVPYQLHDFGSNENDLLGAFLALFALLAISVLILFVTAKLTVGRRASLGE